MSNEYDATNADDFPPFGETNSSNNEEQKDQEAGRSPGGRSRRLRNTQNNKGETLPMFGYEQQKKPRPQGTSPMKLDKPDSNRDADDLLSLGIKSLDMSVSSPARNINDSFATTGRVLDEELRQVEMAGTSQTSTNNNNNTGRGTGRGAGRGGRGWIGGRSGRGGKSTASARRSRSVERASSLDGATTRGSRGGSTKRSRSRSKSALRSTKKSVPMSEKELNKKRSEKKGGRASFDANTKFTQKATPGGTDSSANSRRTKKKQKKSATPNPKEVVIEDSESEESEEKGPSALLQTTFFAEMKLKFFKPKDGTTLGDSAVKLLEWLLETGATKDKDFCLLDPEDDDNRLYKGKELGDWDDIFPTFTAQYSNTDKYCNVLKEDRVLNMLMTVKIGCSLTQASILQKIRLKTANVKRPEGEITLAKKTMQEFDTRRHIILSGIPNDVDVKWFTGFITPELEKARASMMRNNTERFRGVSSTDKAPEFLVERDWVLNTPFEKRDPKDSFKAYTKQALQVTCKTQDYEFMESIFIYMMGSKRLQQLFGPFAKIAVNCGPDGDTGERLKLRDDVEFHAATCNNMGKVVLTELNKPDYLMELEMEDDHVGEREAVVRSVREIMSKVKVGGVKLWQTVLLNSKGVWMGYYTEGVGGDERSTKAINWGESFGGNMHYYMADRGVEKDSVTAFINKVMTNKGAREAFAAKRIDGMVYSEMGASRQQLFQRAQETTWFDVTKGMSDARKLEYEAEQRAKQDMAERAAVKPGDRDALNFDERTMGSSKGGSMNYTVKGDEATMGSTRFFVESEDDDSSSAAFGSTSSWQEDDGGGKRFEGIDLAARDIENRRGRGREQEEMDEDEDEEEENEEGADLEMGGMETENQGGGHEEERSVNSHNDSPSPGRATVHIGFHQDQEVIYTRKGLMKYSQGIVTEVYHCDEMIPYYVIDVGGRLIDTEGRYLKLPPKFVHRCGDRVYVASTSSDELLRAKIDSYSGDPLCPLMYKLVYEDSEGLVAGPVPPVCLYPCVLKGEHQTEADAINHLIKMFPLLREHESETPTDDNVDTAAPTDTSPEAVQGQNNSTDNQDSELMEQSTDQQRSDEDNSQERHPSHQVPNSMSAEDSSEVPPRDEVQGQGDGGEHPGSDHNPD